MDPPGNDMKLDLELVDLIMKGARVEIWRSTKDELIEIASESGLVSAGASIWMCHVKWEASGIYDVPGKLTKKIKRKTIKDHYRGNHPVRYCLSVSPPSEDRFISEKVWP